jgi:hypothetical protein
MGVVVGRIARGVPDGGVTVFFDSGPLHVAARMSIIGANQQNIGMRLLISPS